MITNIHPSPNTALPPHHFDAFCTAQLGLSPQRVRADLERWLEEDHGAGDVTVFSALGLNPTAAFQIIAKEDFVLAGLPLMAEVFRLTAGSLPLQLFSAFNDQDPVPQGAVVLEGVGFAASILLAERVALNLTSRLCGVATKTKGILDALARYQTQTILVETRKTTPGLRVYEKYAIRCAGTRNHRHGLDAGAMLKENHLRVLGGVVPALECLQAKVPLLTKIEVEVTTLAELQQALPLKPDVLMLDHFDLPMIQQAVALRNQISSSTKLEVSGNLDQKNLEAYATSGVDYLSMGALIHKAYWVDMSLQISHSGV